MQDIKVKYDEPTQTFVASVEGVPARAEGYSGKDATNKLCDLFIVMLKEGKLTKEQFCSLYNPI